MRMDASKTFILIVGDHTNDITKRYQAIFYVKGDTVYLDAVLDCRMDNTGVI